MSEIFSWTSAQFGLAVGLLIVGIATLAKVVSVKDRALLQRYEKEIANLEVEKAELRVERDLYRDRWIEALGAAEVGTEATKRLVGGTRRPGGR